MHVPVFRQACTQCPYMDHQRQYFSWVMGIYHECEGRIEKSVPRITVWHHEACRVMKSGDPEGRIFYPNLTRIMDSFFLLTTLIF